MRTPNGGDRAALAACERRRCEAGCVNHTRKRRGFSASYTDRDRLTTRWLYRLKGMRIAVAQPLDYASPTLRRRFNPATWPTFGALSVIVLMAGALSTTGGHVVPGGPFISIHVNVTPAVACLAVIAVVWRVLRTARGPLRFCAAVLVLGSALVVIFVIQDIMMFWLRPYARGVLFAW